MDRPRPLVWYGDFSVLPSETPSCRNLPGDKIILPHSALEQLLRAALYTTAQNTWHLHNENDKLPNPLIFRLTNTKNNNEVYAGVKEFSAPEGMVGLSSFLLEALKVEPDDYIALDSGSQEKPVDPTRPDAVSEPSGITVRAVPLPRGTYVRLRPLEAGYNPDNWKPLLERQLRQSFTSLTMNTVLSVRGVRGEEFKLLVDKITPEGGGICVVDTDLVVDIEALDEEQARETLRQIISKGNSTAAGGSSVCGELDIWKDVDGRVLPGEYVDYVLPSWDRSQELSITLSGLVDETSLDLFVTPKSRQQRALPRESVHSFGDFSPARHGSKTITISPTNIELEGAESILISVHAYQNTTITTKEPASPISYTIRAKADPVRGNDAAKPIEIDGQDHSSNDEQCKNCQQWVPKQSMILHQNFCLRNNVLCPRCKSVFKKGSTEWESHWHCEDHDAHGNSPASKAKHDEVFHAHRECPSCEFSTNSLPDLARHRTSTCPGKIILCCFCHLEVPQEGDPFNISPEVALSGLTAHELADGARTTECHLCDKIVRLRDMETHMKHHELDKYYRSKPKICRNVNCGRTLLGVGPKGQFGVSESQQNDMGFCPVCFGPLYVSLYDPQNTALRRRVERRYLSQLMTGCGKVYCANEWCKTGRSNTGREARLSTVGQLTYLIQPLLVHVFDANAPAYFCVDETSQAGRKAAEMVAAQQVWDLEWCIAAAEAEKGNIDKMMDWLNGWAPKKQPE